MAWRQKRKEGNGIKCLTCRQGRVGVVPGLVVVVPDVETRELAVLDPECAAPVVDVLTVQALGLQNKFKVVKEI